MMQRWSSPFGVGRRLVVLAMAACLAVLVTVLVSNKPAQSDTAFEYALPINAAELNDAELDRTLDKAKSAGVNSISSGAVWWYLNEDRTPRSYDWSFLDRLIAGTEERGMKVSLQLSGTPDWVHPDLKGTVPSFSDRIWYPPKSSTELDHWRNFVSDVVSRYKGRVARYEMWNEPNIDAFWKPSPKPAEYAALLRAGYLSAKRAYPDASVVFGGLSRNDVGYLKAYYSEAEKYSDAASESYFFDVMNVHPYSSINSTTPEESISPDRNTSSAVFEGAYGMVDQNFLGIEKIKSVMDSQGDSGKSIFLGEYGFPTTDTWLRSVPDFRRALYLKRAYAQARSLPYVEGLSWYYYRPSSSDGPEWSLVDANLNETKTFRALRQATGAESTVGEVSLSAPQGSVSGTYNVTPVLSGLSQEDVSVWELYVDGDLAESRSQAPLDWDTQGISNGTHSLMIAAYTREGTVFASEPISVSVNNTATGRVQIGSLGTDKSTYAVGDTVEVTATLSADVATAVDQINIAARPKGTEDSSRFVAFYDEAPYTLEKTPKTIAASKTMNEPGTYVLWVSYLKDDSWHWLTPEKEFAVGTEAAPTPPKTDKGKAKKGKRKKHRGGR